MNLEARFNPCPSARTGGTLSASLGSECSKPLLGQHLLKAFALNSAQH